MKPVQTGVGRRIVEALRAVLPPAVAVEHQVTREDATTVSIGSRKVRVAWAGAGGLRQVRPFIESDDRPDIVVARLMSAGARDALSKARVGWLDQTGAAEIAIGTLIVSRTGKAPPKEERKATWSPAVFAVAEAVLCGTAPTLSATAKATGLSSGSCTHALRTLAEMKLLTSTQARGPRSARRVVDPDDFLDAYAAAVAGETAKLSLVVGVTWQNAVPGLRVEGPRWTAAGLEWAATGLVAASVLAPLVTNVGSAEVYVDAKTPAELDAFAARAGLTPIEGGRLTLKPFPTVTARRMAMITDDIRVAPWPRVYADVKLVGVRGEEAAEHLREVTRGG